MLGKIALLFGISISVAAAQTAPLSGYCILGGSAAKVSGLSSTNYLQGIIPSCTVTVYLTGTQTLATIYKDGNNTPLGNPFTANNISSTNPGGWQFYAAQYAGLDVVLSGGLAPNTYPSPVTALVDAVPGSGIGGPFCPLSGCTFTGPLSGTSATFSGTVTAGTVNGQTTNHIPIASQFTGADLGAKINAANASLGSTPGEIQVDASAGTTISTAINISAGNSLKFVQGGTYTVSSTIVLGANSSLIGPDRASGDSPLILQEAAGSGLACVVSMPATSGHDTLDNVYIDANRSGQGSWVTWSPNTAYAVGQEIIDTNGNVQQVTSAGTSGSFPPVASSYPAGTYQWATSGTTTDGTVVWTYQSAAPAMDGVCITDSNRDHILNTEIHNAVRDNLHVTSPTSYSSSGSAYIGPNVLFGNAGRDGAFVSRSSDLIVGSQVEFESNGRDGLHGEDSATLRCSLCDFGGNRGYGAVALTTSSTSGQSSGWVLSGGSQFGNNILGDFYANGSASPNTAENGNHTITGDGFIGPLLQADAKGTLTVSGGQVTAINLTSTGYGQYVSTPTPILSASCGATFNLSVSGGNLSASVASPGSSCPSNLTISFAGGLPATSIKFVDAPGNTVVGNVMGWPNNAAKHYNWAVSDSFSALTSGAQVPTNVSGNNFGKWFYAWQAADTTQQNNLQSPVSLPSIDQLGPNVWAGVGGSLGQTTINTNGLNNGFIVRDVGSNGGNIRIIGNGSTTPSKTIKVLGGNFSIVNDAYSQNIFTLTDSGDMYGPGASPFNWIPHTATRFVGGNLGGPMLGVSYSQSVTPVATTVSSCTAQTFTGFTGLTTAQKITGFTAPITWNTVHYWIPAGGVYVSAAGTLSIQWCADATGGTPPAGTVSFVAN